MTRRFTSVEKWRDPWFSELDATTKLLFCYLCDACDLAGVWEVNRRAAEFDLCAKVDWDAAMRQLGDRIEVIAGGRKWRLVKFIKFQYPKGLVPECPAHQAVIRKLRDHGIPITAATAGDREDASSPIHKGTGGGGTPMPRGRLTDKDKDTDQDKDLDGDTDTDRRSADVLIDALRAHGLSSHPDAVAEWAGMLRRLKARKSEVAAFVANAIAYNREHGFTVRFARQAEAYARDVWPSDREAMRAKESA